jgi:2-dehydro-3-deoxygalactonokinase
MNPLPPLIAVDWGSTRLRAKLVLDGAVAGTVLTDDGIRNRSGRDFESILTAACGPWKRAHPEARVLASGMVGAREGWREAPYVPAPCGLEDVAARLVSVPSPTFGEVLLVPGARWDDPATGQTDVMRGEETQALGRLAVLRDDDPVVLCLPGTHSKWVLGERRRLRSFRTWLTGEAYELLTARDSLISGDGTPACPENPAFRDGVAATDAPGGLLHHLFLARTRMLSGRIAPSETRSFVSGVLVGHEIREALAFADRRPIHLVGDSPAVRAVSAALRFRDIPFSADPAADDHLAGLAGIAEIRFSGSR